MGATDQLLPFGEGAPLSSLAALPGSRGPLGQCNPPAPSCWARSDLTRWLWRSGEGPLSHPVPSQPQREERGGAISAHRQRQNWVTFTVSSFQTAKLG